MGASYMAHGLRYGSMTAQGQLEKTASALDFARSALQGVKPLRSLGQGGGLGALAGAASGLSHAGKTWGLDPASIAALRKTVDAEKGATILSGQAADAKRQLDMLQRLDDAGINQAARSTSKGIWDYASNNPAMRGKLLGAIGPSIGGAALKGGAAGTAAHAAASGVKSAVQARALQPYLMPAAIGGGALLGYGLGR